MAVRVFTVHLLHFFEIALVYMIYRVQMRVETYCKADFGVKRIRNTVFLSVFFTL